ncbi:CRTAC1 family protein [Actinomadura xylanilytica]|uniref:CRTAC1 family protein n=1 Tax=Actinomadura xylanilytica TaxID=887459 RepID=UPI00255AA6B5|nr:CRTAC1 family protein [Actinomadura xylanilytica]MDL4777351.1 CRTAC1 family protein [Actinomadura xylanilytica]
MASLWARKRRFIPGLTALALILALYFVARLPTASADTRAELASRYRFTEMPIAMPPGYKPTQTERTVNPAFRHLRSWISAVGAAVAINDLQGNGRPDDMCLVDTRTDKVVVTYAPTAPAADRFTPFALDPAPLPVHPAMAPMGCAPGDFNGDGRMDLMVYYWGRTPILFLAKTGTRALAPDTYERVELVPQGSADGAYHGPRWNTNAVNVADFDGDGHADILVSNYFPDSDVLDPHGLNNVQMNASMSNAKNGGGSHVLRWQNATAGPRPTATFAEARGALPFKASSGWTLAASSADLTGDGVPELYLANDFGKDHLLHNRSTPGTIRFGEVIGKRSPTTPKSFVIGKSSFKGMGVDFGDLNNSGRFDMSVSNITTAWGLEESNFTWINQAGSEADMQRRLAAGEAPYTQKAREMGLAFTGWGWDVKMGDFRNSGKLEIVQTEGFVKGKINRWPWLQEMAMTNDNIYTNPAMWPNVQPGDDIAGSQPVAFYARQDGGPFANLTKELGLAVPIPTRGVAMADTRRNGALDFALARQWGPPAFYANNSPNLGRYLDLHLFRPVAGRPDGKDLQGIGSPAYGVTVRARTADGRTHISQLDGGSGHSGKRSFEVRFGLGRTGGPVEVELQWRDTQARLHKQTVRLNEGDHTLLLDTTAKEVPSR